MKNDPRAATAFLNYKKKVNPDPFRPLGPTAFNEMVWPVEISENGKRVGFSYIAPGEDE
jgi:hypothetical protein